MAIPYIAIFVSAYLAITTIPDSELEIATIIMSLVFFIIMSIKDSGFVKLRIEFEKLSENARKSAERVDELENSISGSYGVKMRNVTNVIDSGLDKAEYCLMLAGLQSILTHSAKSKSDIKSVIETMEKLQNFVDTLEG